MDILSTAAKTTVKARLQVWIAYGLIGIAVAAGGLGAASYVMLQKQKVTSAKLATQVNNANTRVAVVEAANKSQGEAIEAIKTANKVSDSLITSLQTNVDAINRNNRKINDQLASVRETNEAAKKYLAAAVPGPVGCVLDGTCTADANAVSEAKQGLDAAVQSAADKTKQN